MRLSSSALSQASIETGFNPEPLEKVVRLLDLLTGIQAHPYLKGRLVLKGGTALNLFHFDVPRLSVDIDLNYVGGVERETMLEERPKVEQAIAAVCGRADLSVRRAPTEHAGGKWRLRYTDVGGRQGNLELDLNFLMRVPLWPQLAMNSRPLGPFSATAIPVNDIHELAAGKLAALFSRAAARDLYDVCRILEEAVLEPDKLRLAFVVYGGISRRDWREIKIDDIDVAAADVSRQLVPMLKAELAPGPGGVAAWTHEMVATCRRLCAQLLPLKQNEMDFLEALNGGGEIVPELLTGDKDLQTKLRVQPGLLWKAHNVRQHQRRT
jgi:predicted nucleotidyltransferase component of viral defense system